MSKQAPQANGKRPCPFCDHHNKHGHINATCYQIHGFLDKQGKKPLQTTSNINMSGNQPTLDQYNKLLALLAKDESSGSFANLAGIALTCFHSHWIIDSSASNHICTFLSFFPSYTPVTKRLYVHLPDGSQAIVTHIGIVCYFASLTLKNVFYISSFKCNLLSISQLTNSIHCDVICSSSGRYFQDHTMKKMISWGSAQHGLFYLDAPLVSNSAFSFQICNNFDVWHVHLGQPSKSRFNFLLSKFPSIVANKNFVCDVCPQEKHAHFPFPISMSTSSHCFELIHVDIWGAF